MKKSIVVIFLLALMLQVCPIHAELADSSSNSASLSISLLNQDPDPAITGEVTVLRFSVENLGGQSASNVVVELLPQYPFELVSGESATQSIGNMRGYQTQSDMRVVKYKVRVDKDATAGDYELQLRISSEGGTIASLEKVVLIEVKSRESAQVIRIDKANLVPGQQSSLKFTVTNVGNSPLRDLAFS
ncbi:MAG: hypothetical protein V1644_03625, partial [Candidatus Micrarchaeota archaeon]